MTDDYGALGTAGAPIQFQRRMKLAWLDMRFPALSVCVLMSICFACVAALGAENAGGNKGVLMQKRPAQQAPLDRAKPKETPAPKPTREKEPPKPVAAPAKPGPEPNMSITVPANWPSALNEYFQCALTDPSMDEAMGALVGHLNRVTLLGTEPEAESKRFETWLKAFRREAPKREADIRVVENLYRNLMGWVELESQFTIEPGRDVLKQLVKIVQSQAQLDPNYDPARKEKIVNTIEQQGLFVPSGILFGYSVLPYRAVLLPKGYVPFETPVKPTFSDTTSRAQALYDFIEAPGPIFRIDFDSVDAARVRVEQSQDGARFQDVQEWKSSGPGGVRSPVIVAAPFRARYMRLTVESEKETAVLRNPRIFALKEPSAAISTLEHETPTLDGSFKETPWPRKAQIDGFVNPETRRFAEAQTTVRVCHTTNALYIAVYAREPRMSTMACTLTARDAPLWQEESIAIVLRPKGQPEFRLVTNPLGAQFDSKDGNDTWDGDWQVATKTWPVGWSAEIAVPFATLGATPGKEDWELDFARTRRNVENERSVWVYSEEPAKKEKGLLIF